MRKNILRVVDILSMNGYSNDEIEFYLKCTYGEYSQVLSEMKELIEDWESENDFNPIEDCGYSFNDRYCGEYLSESEISMYVNY